MRLGDVTPLKFCVKYSPPALALYYTLATTPGKNYLHVIDLANLITEQATSADLYQKLAEREGIYLSRELVPRRQVIKLLDQLLAKHRPVVAGNNNKKKATSGEPAPAGSNSVKEERSKISLDSMSYTNPVLVTDLNDLEKINAESIVVAGTNAAPLEERTKAELPAESVGPEPETRPSVKEGEEEEKATTPGAKHSEGQAAEQPAEIGQPYRQDPQGEEAEKPQPRTELAKEMINEFEKASSENEDALDNGKLEAAGEETEEEMIAKLMLAQKQSRGMKRDIYRTG